MPIIWKLFFFYNPKMYKCIVTQNSYDNTNVVLNVINVVHSIIDTLSFKYIFTLQNMSLCII